MLEKSRYILIGLLLFLHSAVFADGGYGDSPVFELDVCSVSLSHYCDSQQIHVNTNPCLSTAFSDSQMVDVDSFRVNKAWADSASFQLRTTDIHINFSDKRQEIDGFGGSFAMWGYNPDAGTLKKVTQELGTTIVRIQADAGGYDVNTSTWDSNDHSWQKSFAAAKASFSFGVDKFILSFWNPPASLLTEDKHWIHEFGDPQTHTWAYAIVQRIDEFGNGKNGTEGIWDFNPESKVYVSLQNESNLIDPNNGKAVWAYWKPSLLADFYSYVKLLIENQMPDDEDKIFLIGPELTSAEPYDNSGSSEPWSLEKLDLFENSDISKINYHIYDSYQDKPSYGTEDNPNDWPEAGFEDGYNELTQRLAGLYDQIGEGSWMTETTGAQWNTTDWHTFGWHTAMSDIDKAIAAARYIHSALVDAHSSAFLWWGLTFANPEEEIIDLYASDEDERPYYVEKFRDEGLVLVDHDSEPMHEVETTKKYYAFKQYSYFIKPSYMRVGTDNYSCCLASAYKSADNKTVVLVIINPAENEENPLITGIESYQLCGAFRTDSTLDCNDILSQCNPTQPNIPAKSITTLIYSTNRLLGDFEPDGDVDFHDLAMLMEQWLKVPGSPSADIAPQPNGDNFVDFQDFALFAKNWLAGIE